MAYILQQRRDTLTNWNSYNPILADAEIGFIRDFDENGKQKTSLYKIGDGKTKWRDLPLFGFGGDIYDAASAWTGSDLDTTVASQQAVLNKIAEKINDSETTTNNSIESIKNELITSISNVLNGTEDTEGVVDKLSKSQLVQLLHEGEGEFEEGTLDEDKIAAWSDQIVSRAIVLAEFKKVWEALGLNEDSDKSFIQATNTQLEALKTFADTYSPIVDGLVSTVESHDASIEKHEKDIYGWDEEVVTGTDEETGEEIKETVHHDSIDEKIDKVKTKVTDEVARLDEKIDTMHQIMTEKEYVEIHDFSVYPEGTLIFTYKEE